MVQELTTQIIEKREKIYLVVDVIVFGKVNRKEYKVKVKQSLDFALINKQAVINLKVNKR